MRAAWDSSAHVASLPGDGPATLSAIQCAARQCAAALRQLLSDPRCAPRLVVAGPQAQLIRDWLGPEGAKVCVCVCDCVCERVCVSVCDCV